MMTNGDPEGEIFLPYPHTKYGFFFLLTTVFIYLFIDLYLFPGVSEYAKMQYDMMTSLDVLSKIAWVLKIIRIFHECEGRIEKYVPRINIWHHDAC